jgi:hypothetical protein
MDAAQSSKESRADAAVHRLIGTTIATVQLRSGRLPTEAAFEAKQINLKAMVQIHARRCSATKSSPKLHENVRGARRLVWQACHQRPRTSAPDRHETVVKCMRDIYRGEEASA